MGSVEVFARQVREISKLKFRPSTYIALGLYIIPYKKDRNRKQISEFRSLELFGSSLMLKLIFHVFAEGM